MLDNISESNEKRNIFSSREYFLDIGLYTGLDDNILSSNSIE